MRDVYVISDTYTESVAVADNVGIYGGYAADGSRSRANTTVIHGAPQAVFAEGDTGIVLQLLTLDGSARPPDRAAAASARERIATHGRGGDGAGTGRRGGHERADRR